MPDVNAISQVETSRVALKAARPWFDVLREFLGYKFPRLGPFFFRCFYAAVRKHRCVVELVPGIFVEMNFDDLTHKGTYWQGKRFEYPTAEVLCEWAGDPRCKVFFDIGANYGFFSYLVRSQFPLQVHAFDPNPVNYGQLLTAQSQNGLVDFYPHHLGLSDKEGVLSLHHGVVDQGHSTFLVNPCLGNSPVSDCRVVRFDDWISRQTELFPLPDGPRWIVKIDVEGYELKVLRGMEISLRSRRFLGLVVELNSYTLSLAGTSPGEVCRFLAGCGYKAYQETREGRRWPLHRAPNGFFVPSP